MISSSKKQEHSALNGLRIVEIPSEYTEYCGKLYSDMGADVIIVEPPTGTELRCRAPFFRNRQGPNSSISFNYYNAGKRSVEIDLETDVGRNHFRSLIVSADVLIDGLRPGRLAQIGCGYEVLAGLNPLLTMVSVSPFGQTGPWAEYQGDDLTLHALGGMLFLGGYADAEPTVIYGNQAYLAAAQFAAVSSMAAVLSAQETGLGHYIDVSAHEAVVLGLENAAQFYQLEGKLRRRIGGAQTMAGNGQFPCKDGEFYMLAGGLASMRFWTLAVMWLNESKAPGAEQLLEPCWQDRAFLATDDAKKTFFKIFSNFAKIKTKAELFEECRKRRIPAAPVATPADVLQNAQMKHRGFFTTVPSKAMEDEFVAPGAPYQLSATPPMVAGGSPDIGEHTQEILTKVKTSAQGRIASNRSRIAKKPLNGIRIIDFSWVGAGSYTTKMLADLGADVIKIESTRKIDDLRMAPPFKDGKAGVNRSGYFADRNTSKRSMLLDLKKEGGLQIARQLIAKCDVVANNFAPGVMEKLGLGYSELSRLNPKLVYLSMSAQGSDGPESDLIGYGLTLAALSGVHHLSGRPDRESVGTGTHYPDHIPNPCHAAFAVLAALHFQRNTGRGQKVDLAQTEPMAALIGPALIECSFNNVEPKRTGNRNGHYAPRGVFPCRGTDRWIAISVRNETQWAALVRVVGQTLDRPKWSTVKGRLADQESLEAVLAQESARFEPADLMSRLQVEGVAAGIVQTAADVVDQDVQLKHRQHWKWLEHKEMGSTMHNGQPFVFQDVDVSPTSAAPLLGEHTDEVCKQILGLTDTEIELLKKDVLI